MTNWNKFSSLSLRWLALTLVVIAAGCAQTAGPPETLKPGAISSDVSDAATFMFGYSSLNAHVTESATTYMVTSRDNNGNEVTFEIPKQTTVPYTVTAKDAGVTLVYYDKTLDKQYEANAVQGSCTITVTAITSTTVEGSFSGETICSTISDKVRRLSDGFFKGLF